MTAYKTLKGQSIRQVAQDPTNPIEGQIWYNTTIGVLKGLPALSAWSSGGNLVTARAQLGGAGTQTAGLAFGGYPGGSATGATEEYNGSGWGAGGTMITARREVAGLGIQTAALAVGGFISPSSPTQRDETELYNGTSWSEQNDLTTEKRTSGAAGTTSAGLVFGGLVPPNTSTDQTEEWDGTNWSEQNNLNTTRSHLSGAGTQTAALGFGGYIAGSGGTGATEEYDGSSWTTVSSMNTGRRTMGPAGTQTAALGFGGSKVPGSPTTSNATEEYDGTTWSTSPATLALGRRDLGGCGTQPAALAFGGNGPSPNTASTEEYNKSINVITAAAFSSGGNMPEATSKVADGGTQTAAVKGGGQKNNPDSLPTSSAEYNGSSWTAGNTLPSSYGSNTGATGTQTALITGGANNPTPGGTFEYDGTNWTAGGTLGTSRYGGKTLGTQTAAVTCGGRVAPPTLNNVEEYDGSSWTAVTAMPIATREQGGFGTQTAGVVVSGFQGPSSPPVSPSPASRGALGFNYDGTNWTAGTSSLFAGSSGGAAGIQTVGFFLAGSNPALSPSLINISQTYDGTSYTTNASVARSRATQFGITSARTAAVGTAAMIFGGGDPSNSPQDTAATEEYNVATSALNVKKITSST